jgi:hypothetical protein
LRYSVTPNVLPFAYVYTAHMARKGRFSMQIAGIFPPIIMGKSVNSSTQSTEDGTYDSVAYDPLSFIQWAIIYALSI